jgi:hypothetical protein
MNSTFQKNIDAFKTRFKCNDEAVEALRSTPFEFEHAPSIRNSPVGLPNIYYGQGESEMSVFDDRNPYADIQTAIKQFEGKKISHVISLGLNFGFLTEEVLNQNTDLQRILIVEPSGAFFLEQLEIMDLSSQIANEKVSFIIGKNVTDSVNHLAPHFQIASADMQQWSFALIPNSLQLYGEFSKEFIAQFGNLMYYQKLNANTATVFGTKFLKNYLENVTHLPKSHYVSQIADKFDGERCVIISAGPSLEKQLPLLKAIQNKIVLISVGAALPTLHAHDINPHFVVLIDPIELNINDFSSGKFTREILISSLVGNSSVVANFQGKKFFTQYSQAFDEALNNPFGKMCFMDSAGSVANCAYAFAKIIGMKSIAFVGQDLAYTGGVSHALGHQQREDKTPEAMEKDAGMKKVAGYYGDTVYTTIAMDVFKAWFEARFAADKDITVLNCTEGGAMIKGSIQQPLQTLADEVLMKPDLNISPRLDVPVAQIPSIKSLFQKDLADINSVSQILSASLSSFKQVRKNDQDQKAMTKAIKMITSFKDYLTKVEKSSAPHVNYIMTRALLNLSKENISDADSSLEVLNKLKPHLTDLRTGCETYSTLLLEVLKTLRQKPTTNP